MAALLCDIGGTNIRFSILENDIVSEVMYFKTGSFRTFEDALAVYLKKTNTSTLQKMILGVAGPVKNGYVKLTNADFEVSQTRLEKLYPDTRIAIVNDFVLQGYGVLETQKTDLRILSGPDKNSFDNPKLVLGPGTGLGSCFLIPNNGTYTILSSESGHTTLSAISPNQQKILALLTKEETPISFEDVISGSGLCRLYQAILKINQLLPDADWLKTIEEMKQAFNVQTLKETGFVPLLPKEITALAEKEEEIALLTFWYFFEFLGIYASNLALTIKAEGGVYLVGNLLNQPQIKHLLLRSNFKKYFEMKGIFADYLKQMPIFLVEKKHIQIDGLVCLSKNI